MSKFGWSLPPGVTTLPGEERVSCAVCGAPDDDCACPECPVCRAAGDPDCYTGKPGVDEPHIAHLTTDQEVMRCRVRIDHFTRRALDEQMALDHYAEFPDAVHNYTPLVLP